MNFNMLVCHWASLGYLSMFVNEKGNVILRRRIDMGNERRKMECRLFEALFGGNDLCDGAEPFATSAPPPRPSSRRRAIGRAASMTAPAETSM